MSGLALLREAPLGVCGKTHVHSAPRLFGTVVLSKQAAARDAVVIPWAVKDTSHDVFCGLLDLMAQCLHADRKARPSIGAVVRQLEGLQGSLGWRGESS
jgi:hypothetical protein